VGATTDPERPRLLGSDTTVGGPMADDGGVHPPGEDIDLARAVVAGDDAAFDAFYRRYARPVHDYALGIVRDRSLAEDVTQTTFLRAYEQRTSVRDPAAVRGWLYRIAHNVAINQVSRTRPTDEIPDDAALPDRGFGPEEALEQDETVRLVWDAAASLEARQFTVLDLALRKGLSSAEIGTVLGLDPPQASLALHRARKALGDAVRFLVVARRRRHCDRLAELVPAGVRSLSTEQRASVDRHVRRCPDCQRAALVLTAPGELFGAIPFALLPAALSEWRSAASTPAQVAFRAPTQRTQSRLRRLGRSRRLLAAGGAVAVVAGVVGVVSTVNRNPAYRGAVAPPPVTARTTGTAAAASLRGRIVFGTGSLGQGTLGETNPDGSDTHRLGIGDPTCCHDAALSPDGTRLVFAGERVIRIGHSDGTGDRVLWASPTDGVGALAWSPSGRQIAFSANGASTTGPPPSVIYTLNADGTDLRRVCAGLNVHALAWSPDGAQLAFLQNQGNIWAVATAGGSPRVLFGPLQGEPPAELPESLSWAPASSLLFAEIGSHPEGVWQVNSDGTGVHSVLPHAASPSWGPDGSHFAAAFGGRIVIASVGSPAQHTIGPPGVAVVNWAGPP
jgi:RNA polymerase sigma factor (sigma-70 family)